MSNQQDPAAASAPFDSRANGAAGRTLANGKPSDSGVQAPEGERVITVVARRYKFEPARIEVTEGERVRLVVSSEDGVHGLEVKKLKINKKVPRDGEVTIEFVATEPGEFPILCSEYCGKGHDVMKGMLVVAAKSVR
jgi:cytochrome c oxidase subunit 2